MQTKKYEVPVDRLRWRCDPNLFKFECTKDLSPLREFIGQDRAIRAVEFGLSMPNDGYNIYVAGLTGTGKTSMVSPLARGTKMVAIPRTPSISWSTASSRRLQIDSRVSMLRRRKRANNRI